MNGLCVPAAIYATEIKRRNNKVRIDPNWIVLLIIFLSGHPELIARLIFGYKGVIKNNAIKLTNETISIDRSRCNSCGECAEVCYPEAIQLLGQSMTVDDLVKEVKKDIRL